MKPYLILFIFILFSCDGDLIEEIESDPCNDYVCEYSECDVIKAKHQLLTKEYESTESYVNTLVSATKGMHPDCIVPSQLFGLLDVLVQRSADIQDQIKQLEDSSDCI